MEFTNHFGNGSCPTIFGSKVKNSKGELRCCAAQNFNFEDVLMKFYGIYDKHGNKVDFKIIRFCSYCIENGFDESDKIFDCEHRFFHLQSFLFRFYLN